MDVTQILYVLFLLSCAVIVPYILGAAITLSLKIRFSRACAYITGIVFVYALNEVLCLPFMLTEGDYEKALLLFVMLITVCFFIALLYLSENGYLQKLLKIPKSFDLLTVSIFVLILLQMAVEAFYTRIDGDDAFYIAITTTIQQTGKIFSNNPSIGLDAFVFPPNYKFTAFEILTTFLSTLFHIDGVVLCHSVFPVIVIGASYVAYLMLAQSLFEETKKQKLFVLILALLTLFDGYSNYLSSSFILLKAWMGKTLTINICCVALLSYFMEIYKKSLNGTLSGAYFLLIAICLISGPGTSAVGLYLLPVYYFILFVGYFFYIKRSQKLKYVIFSVLAAVPSALFLLGYFFMLRTDRGLSQLLSFEQTKTWLEIATEYFGDNWFLFLVYVFFGFYFILTGNVRERVSFGFAPLLLLISFLNPFLYPFVGHYLTSFPVYWRFFWLLPVFFTISAGLVRLLEGKRSLKAISLVLLVFFLVPSAFALTDVKYYGAENSAKIPDATVSAVKTIKENVTTDDPQKLYLLALPAYNIYVRQYTGEIAMVLPRANYVEEAFRLAGREYESHLIGNLFTYDEKKNISGFVDRFDPAVLKQLGITLIIAPSPRPELSGDFVELHMENKDYLYIEKSIFKTDKKKSRITPA